MLNQFSRTQLLLGADNMDRLSNAKVAVFGIGGVGGYVVEALARSGVGSFVLVDDDKVCLTNINRQIIATRKTVGKYKVDVMKERILEINPDADVEVRKCPPWGTRRGDAQASAVFVPPDTEGEEIWQNRNEITMKSSVSIKTRMRLRSKKHTVRWRRNTIRI